MYSSFDAHKIRDHPNCGVPDFKNEIILTEAKSQPMQSQAESDEDDDFQSSPVLDAPECVPLESLTDTGELQAQLRNNLASMFLKMHSVLHVSETAIQHIVENLARILSLSKPLVRDSVIRVFQEHGQSISNAVFKESVEAVMLSNVFVSATTKGAELSTAKRRKTYVQTNYLLVNARAVYYRFQWTQSSVCSNATNDTMFNNTDVFEKIQETKPSSHGMYMTHEDGTYFKENDTGREIHKLCAVNWLLANVPSMYRSSLHVIQLALLCKVPNVQRYRHQSVLEPS